MKLVITGPGALGCLAGSILSRGLFDEDSLHILDYNEERTQTINSNGLIYEKDGQLAQYQVQASSSPTAIGKADALFLCVKSYDIHSSLSFCAPLLKSDTLLVFLQNGIAHLDVAEHTGSATCVYGTTTEGATRLAPGHIRHAGSGITYLGFLDEVSAYCQDLLSQVSARLERGGAEVVITDTIKNRLWAKLFINVGINAFTAIWNCKNGELLTLSGVKDEMKAAIAEAELVASSLGIQVETDPYQSTLAVCQSTAQNVSSMLQDVRAKRTTEIEAINGAVVKAGKKAGIDTPVNIALVEKVKKIERSY